MEQASDEGIRIAQQALAARDGKLPDEVTLLVFGPDGDPRNNAVAQWFSEQGVPVYGVRWDLPAYESWLELEIVFKNEPGDNVQELASAWSQYAWDKLPNNATTREGLMLKQKWVGGRWINFI